MLSLVCQAAPDLAHSSHLPKSNLLMKYAAAKTGSHRYYRKAADIEKIARLNLHLGLTMPVMW